MVRCTNGEIFDVAVDLRPASPTFGQHHGVHLAAENGLALVMPPGVAHGFLSLVPNSDVWYQMSVPYVPGAATGVRWDDPDLSIGWPIERPTFVSERDGALPAFAHFQAKVSTTPSKP